MSTRDSKTPLKKRLKDLFGRRGAASPAPSPTQSTGMSESDARAQAYSSQVIVAVQPPKPEYVAHRTTARPALCEFCSRLASLDSLPPDALESYPNFSTVRVFHHPTLQSLLHSTATCNLCQKLVEWLPANAIDDAKVESRNGSYVYAVFRKENWKGGPLSQLMKTLSEWDFDLRSSKRSWTVKNLLIAYGEGPTRFEDNPLFASRNPPDFSLRVKTVQDWIKQCETEHGGCNLANGNALENQLPARFISVATLGSVRLLLTDSLSSKQRNNTKYAALSHCWGVKDMPMKLTKSNLNAYLKELPIQSLPKTFQDAIRVTQEMQIPLLWIDSLCIIQDDKSDWEMEAARMASVYHHSFLTISAAGGENCHHGLDVIDPIEPAVVCCVPSRPTNNTGNTVVYVKRPWQKSCSIDLLKYSPIHTRGWIFQEMVLSRRVVHFVGGTFFWQCHSSLESEDGRVHTTGEGRIGPVHRLASKNSMLDGHAIWHTWMREYFQREFTYPEDSMPALAGVVRLLQKLTGDEPVGGLWRSNLPVQMFWRNRYEPRESQLGLASKFFAPEELDLSQPSWSWMSIKHPAREKIGLYRLHSKDGRDPDNGTVVWMTTVRQVDIQWQGEPYVSPLLRGHLMIDRGPWGVPHWKDEGSDTFWDQQHFQPESALMLPLYVSLHEGSSSEDSCFFHAHFLLVIRDDSSSDKHRYRRVGVQDRWVSSSWDKAVRTDNIKKWILKEKKKILAALGPVETITLV